MNRGISVAATLAIAFALVSTPASAGEFVVLESWEGVWMLENLHRGCDETGGEIEMEADTLCAGQPLVESDPDGSPIVCDGTVTDTEVQISCTFSTEDPEIPGCVITTTVDVEASRTGDTYTATERVETMYTVECGRATECEETLTTGTRTAADPDCDPVPTRPASWSDVKSVYRSRPAD